MLWGSDSEFKALENQNKICSAFYDSEKNDIQKVSRDKKVEIAETTQLTMDEVMDVIDKFSQMKQFHMWLKERK